MCARPRRFSPPTDFGGVPERGAPTTVIPKEWRVSLGRLADFPSVSEVERYAEPLRHVAGRALRFGEVDKGVVRRAGGYDAFIDAQGVIPTRTRNWHDLYNALIWCALPMTKWAIHRAQAAPPDRGAGSTGRTPLQNQLTHLDERGVVVFSSSQELLELVRALRWQELFLAQRRAWNRDLVPLALGHALLESLLDPYIGLVGHCLLVHTRMAPSQLSRAQQDAELRARIAGADIELHPLPVLGIPGWFAANEDDAFYASERYFRSRRWREDSEGVGGRLGRSASDSARRISESQ